MAEHSGVDQGKMQEIFHHHPPQKRSRRSIYSGLIKTPEAKPIPTVFEATLDLEAKIVEWHGKKFQNKIITTANLQSYSYDKKLIVILTGEAIKSIGYEGVKIWVKQDNYYQEDGSKLPFTITSIYVHTSGNYGFMINQLSGRIYFS